MGKQNAIFFVVMVIIPVVFIEALLQTYYRISNGSFLSERVELSINSPDEHRVYKTKPNLSFRQRTNEFDATYYTNSQGLRTDSERKVVNIDKPDNVYRILFLGPSFTFGWANDYEDTYVSIISENVTAPGKDIEIMNLGTPGQPINYQLCWLKEVGYRYRPDMIIETVYGKPGAVPTDCHIPADHPTVHNGYLYNSTDTLRVKILSKVKNSALVFYTWYFYQFVISTEGKTVGIGTELYERNSGISSNQDYDSIVNSYIDNIAMVRATLKYEIPVVFLYVPLSYIVRPADLSRWTVQGLQDPYTLRNTGKQLKELLERQNIPYVDPTDELISKDKETRTYYFLELHFTAAGNKVLAEKGIPVIQAMIDVDIGED